uniref:Zf-HC2 domain-containing protein n=1 Tax=Schlesneria paludicola TaxID=360056 RepID=A0A7C2K259_9PLAN
MDCRQIQSVLALVVGQDPCDPADEQAVRAHLSNCPACRRFRQDLKVSHTALLESRTQPQFRRGLWPQVAACLADWESRPQFARFNVWVPSVAAVVACLLLVSVAALEVDHHSQQWLPSLVQERTAPPRDLFNDPDFSHNRGRLLSRDDVRRWYELHQNQPQQASRRVPRPREIFQSDY